ncbi:MAG: alpha-L-rhamnosidase [Clostridia bacterium]|nr:alpha-L-rhamnosidase [Clostridia bacterium]
MNNVPFGIRKEDILQHTEMDTRVRRFMTPRRILWQSEGVTGAENMLVPAEKQVHFNVPQVMTLQSKDAPASVLLDFGVEFHGNVKLYIEYMQPKRAQIRVRFGESAQEAMAELGGEKNATNDHINRDQVLDVGFLSMPEIGPSGFRFVRIDLLTPNASISFKAVTGIFVYRELEYKGSFNSSDALLNEIWNTAAYTVHLNMQEYVWDGIKRDRLVWIGDIHPEVSTIQAVFGFDESVKKSLDLARDESPLPRMMCTLTTYSLWWVMVHYIWYMQNGDLAYLKEQQAYLKDLMQLFAAYVDDNGSEQLDGNRFFDWPSEGDTVAIHAGLQGILCMGLDAGAKMCRILGEDEVAALCEEKVAKLRSIPMPDTNGNKRAAAMLLLSGVAQGADADALVAMIKNGGAQGMSTFLGYYVLNALSEQNETTAALDIIRTFWGAMLSRGATTFWEDFSMDWLEGTGRIDELVKPGEKDIHGDYGAYCYKGFRHSLCHGWASGPAAYLSRYVLGIEILEPGCKKVRVRPDLGDLEFAEGTYPTPYGVIRVRHEKDGAGKIISTIDAPAEVEIIQ